MSFVIWIMITRKKITSQSYKSSKTEKYCFNTLVYSCDLHGQIFLSNSLSTLRVHLYQAHIWQSINAYSTSHEY